MSTDDPPPMYASVVADVKELPEEMTLAEKYSQDFEKCTIDKLFAQIEESRKIKSFKAFFPKLKNHDDPDEPLFEELRDKYGFYVTGWYDNAYTVSWHPAHLKKMREEKQAAAKREAERQAEVNDLIEKWQFFIPMDIESIDVSDVEYRNEEKTVRLTSAEYDAFIVDQMSGWAYLKWKLGVVFWWLVLLVAESYCVLDIIHDIKSGEVDPIQGYFSMFFVTMIFFFCAWFVKWDRDRDMLWKFEQPLIQEKIKVIKELQKRTRKAREDN